MRKNYYTHPEIVLCTYAARFNEDDFGGVDAIVSLGLRSRKSITAKIQNIAAQLDERGIRRESIVAPLHGLPKGQTGRKTDWPQIEQLLRLSQSSHLAECRKAIAQREKQR